MIKELNPTVYNKYKIIYSIINDKRNDKNFNKLDSLIVKKCFDNACKLSTTEELFRVNTYNMTNRSIEKIINDFICFANQPNFFEKRNLNELIKLSNLSAQKLHKIINANLHNIFIETFNNLLSETTLISYDFAILKCLDNFIIKIHDISIMNLYIKTKDKLLKKMTTYKYNKEIKDKEVNLLCWIDRLLHYVITQEISISTFILLIQKILYLTSAKLNA